METASRSQAGPVPSDIMECRWHAMPVEDALDRLGARATGLNEDEVAARRAVFGENSLPVGRRP
jgi:hypothetical protein